MAVPDSIRALKPTEYGAVEIRKISGHYYVYEISSKWDPIKQKAKKVTGKSVGKITKEDGFIPNAWGTRRLLPLNPIVRNYGAYEILRQLSGKLETYLKTSFPDIYREISVIAQLQLVTGCKGKRIKREFEASYLNDIHPDISCSEYTVKGIISKLAQRQDEMESFMQFYVVPGSQMLFDGTSIFTRAADSFALKGYNPDHKQETQIRLLYIFDRTSYSPVFFRMLPGNIADKSALRETMIASGCRNCMIIGDKGFYSKKNVSFLMENGFAFILPLQYNTRLIPAEFTENSDDHKFDGCFTYKKRIIWHKTMDCGIKGNKVHIYRDDSRKVKEEFDFMQKKETDYECEEGLDIFDDKRRGMFAFVSNTGKTAKEDYFSYKERWDIEQCFDYLKNAVDIGAPHKRTDGELLAWSFINHVSLLYFYGIVRALRDNELNNEYTPEDILAIGKNIYKVRGAGFNDSRVSEISKPDNELLNKLGISFSMA